MYAVLPTQLRKLPLHLMLPICLPLLIGHTSPSGPISPCTHRHMHTQLPLCMQYTHLLIVPCKRCCKPPFERICIIYTIQCSIRHKPTRKEGPLAHHPRPLTVAIPPPRHYPAHVTTTLPM